MSSRILGRWRPGRPVVRVSFLLIALAAPLLPVISSPHVPRVAIRVTSVPGAEVRHLARGESSSAISVGPFRMLAFSARGSVGDHPIQVRVANRNSAAWGPWTEVAFPDGEGGETEREPSWSWSAPLWTGDADRVQVRGQPDEGTVTALRIHAFDIDRGDGGSLESAVAATATPAVITRAQWGANESLRTAAPSYAPNVKMAFVHHTAGTNSYAPSESDDLIRGIYSYHVQSRGWSDIGYNFLVDIYGQTFEGRYGGIDRAVIGAHAQGFNTGSTGVAAMGTFTAFDPPPATKDALRTLLAWKLDVHHVDPATVTTMVSGGSPKYAEGAVAQLWTISGHRDTGETSCPGDRLYAYLPTLRSGVAATGLPKIYDAAPVSVSVLHPFQVTMNARFSEPSAWNWTLDAPDGTRVASLSGSGTEFGATWNGTRALNGAASPGAYTWTIAATNASGTARPATGLIRILPRYPNGAILKASGPEIWVLRDGILWPVASADAFITRYSWPEIITVSDATLSMYSSAGVGWRDGVLLGSAGAVHIVSNGLRRHITSPETFLGLGLSFSNVRWVDDVAASVHAKGLPVDSPVIVPDGMLVKLSTSPNIYLVKGGRTRHVPTEAVFGSYRVGWHEVATITQAQMTALGAPGGPIGFRDGTLVGTRDGKVWAVADGARRHIANETVFGALGLQFADVVSASPAEATLHPEGTPVTSAIHPNATLLKSASSPAVWMLRNGVRWPITSADAFITRASEWEIVSASDAAIATYPAIGIGWRDGVMLGTPDGRVHLVSGERRRWIATEEVLGALGLQMSNVRWVDQVGAAVHPEGPPILSADLLPDGMFIKQSSLSQSYLVKDGARRQVVSFSAFQSYRAFQSEVATVSSAQMARLGQGPALGFRDGTLIGTPDGKVWVISDGTRRWISSATTFEGMGYQYANIVWVTDAEAAIHPTGAEM